METVKWRHIACATVLLLASSGCVEVGLPASGDTPHGTFWPIFGMHNDPAMEDQQAQPTFDGKPAEGMRYPPAKTISRTHRPTTASPDSEGAERLENPVPITSDSLRYGRIAYEKTCATCHGTNGEGEGPVAHILANNGVAVPALANQRVQRFTDARIYRTISHGVGNMWSYKSQLKPMERWAVVNYLRAMQRAKFPEPWDTRR